VGAGREGGKIMNRRDFLRLMAGSVAGMALPLGAFELSLAADGRKPNVIVIYTDDQGAVDAGCYGTSDIKTPSIDALAESGVRFTQFYSGAPVCSPSRATLMTGKYPLRAGLAGNVPHVEDAEGLPSDQVTIAEMMKRAGYATAHIGKWHLGSRAETSPSGQGFDYTFGHLGGCIDNYSHFFYWEGPNRHDLWRNGKEVYYPGRFFGDLMVEEAGAFLEANRDKPFFLYFAVNMPHYPYQGDEKWLQEYSGIEPPRNFYNAFVSTMDERIGRLMSKVDELGLRGNTIVIFQSDQGHSTEARAFYGGGSAGLYRGAKGSLFEGGIRVPAIISWPDRLPQGAVRNQMVHSADWMPTIAELCGADIIDPDIDGKSILPIIENDAAESPHEILFWSYNNSWAVRKGNWKLLGNPEDTSNKGPLTSDDRLFLVNLSDDVSEMTNIASQNKKIVSHLKKEYERWARKVDPGTFYLQHIK